MNFVCDRCKQKYHVADEKLRGRAVTRFRCKKCENVIELDLAAMAETTPSPEPVTATAPTVTAATVAKPAAKPVPTTAPLSRPRSPTMVGGGAASGPGLGAAKPPVRQRAATVTGTALGGGSALRATAAAARPGVEPARERTTSAILNASENGWYAGIRDLPVGPLTRKELLAKVQSGDVTADTLVWREGLDDWRPLRNVAELGDMLRAGAQKMSGSLLDEMGKRPAPAPRGAQVVPIGTARGASVRPSVAEDDEEATRVSNLDPNIAAMAAKALAREKAPVAEEPEGEDATLVNARRAPAVAAVAPEAPKPAAKPASERPPAVAAVPSERPAAKPASEPAPPMAPAAAHFDDLPEDLFAKSPRPDPAAIAPPTAATVNLAAQAPAPAQPSPLLAPVLTPAPLVAPAVPSIPVPAQPARRDGLSVGVIVLIGGVLVAGVGLGIFIGRKNNAPERSPEVARAATPAVPSPATLPAPAPSVGEPVVAEPVAQPEVVAQPEAAPPAQAAPAAPSETHGTRPHTTRERPSAAASRPALSAQEQAMLRELGGPAATAAGGGPVGNTQLRASPTASAGSGNNSGETDTARFNRAVRTFRESRVADNCWQQILRQNPALRSGAVQISFTVTNTGRFTSFDVANSPDPRFTQCIRSRGGNLAPLGGGGQINGQVSVNLTAN